MTSLDRGSPASQEIPCTLAEGGYHYSDASPSHTNTYLMPVVRSILSDVAPNGRILDLGCGNGAVSADLAACGYDVVGVDPSESAIRIASERRSSATFLRGSAYDDLSQALGRFAVVISLEVVEHVYSPRRFVECVKSCLQPGGIAVLSTPYHGYVKNLAIAFCGRMDRHFTALWEHGHIKFWSMRTMRQLLLETGFHSVRIVRVGRIPWFAKSMIAVARLE